MYSHEFKYRVRYAETDQMGYVYYGEYCKFYEIGRAEAIRSEGITYKELENTIKVMMPVALVESRFIMPAKYDELITIRTILKEMPTKLITFNHEILNESQTVIHKGMVKLFFIDMATNKRVSAPGYVTSKFAKYFE